ncbi:alpha/beta hydrolase-fold protein [Kitasatospora sp. NBC_00070]|uniref:hypothetical protein n=1 Tax=Kitasatospora sp. NBC_00070 TaxID=2975962 RepID=UPI003243668C
MPRPLLVVPLVLALVVGFWLTRAALVRWRDLKSAQTYELVAEQRPLLIRAGGAVLCGMCVTALTVAVALDGRGAHPARAAAVPAERPAAPPLASPSPELPPVVTRFDVIGKPAGGELLEGAVAGPDGRPRTVRVWLPERYKADQQARFPVVVLHAGTARRTADAEVPDVFEGIASAVKLGRARPFVVVAPEAPNGTEHPCELVAAAPQAITDDQALRTAVAAAFRTLPAGPGSWGVLGIEGGAACAAAAGLSRPDLYGAAAAVSGRYDATALAGTGAEAPEGTAAKLLLAAAKNDADGLAAARKLQTALHDGGGRAAKANVRISDVVQDFAPDRERLRLVRVAAQYLAESLTRTG